MSVLWSWRLWNQLLAHSSQIWRRRKRSKTRIINGWSIVMNATGANQSSGCEYTIFQAVYGANYWVCGENVCIQSYVANLFDELQSCCLDSFLLISFSFDVRRIDASFVHCTNIFGVYSCTEIEKVYCACNSRCSFFSSVWIFYT